MSIFGKLFGKKQPAKIKKAVAAPSVTKKVAAKKAAPIKKATLVKKSVSSKKK